MKEKQTYPVEVECGNCDKRVTVLLPKGTLAYGPHECPHCGCKTAHKRQPTVEWKPYVPHYPPAIPIPYDRPAYPWRTWPYEIWCSGVACSAQLSLECQS